MTPPRIPWLFCLALVVAIATTPAVFGQVNINPALDVAGTRTSLGPTEGLLHFVDGGEEVTGWTGVKAPSLAGPADNALGYDRFDNVVNVRTTILTDANGVTAAPNITRDFDYANQIYGQAGISIIQTATRNYTSGANPGGGNVATNFTFPLANADMVNIKTNLNGAQPTVDAYYARSDTDGDRGATYLPANSANPAVFTFDSAVNDTFAHEVGHYLLNQNTFNNAGDTGHSPTATDLMASGLLPRTLPGAAQKGDGNSAPSDPGQAVGNIGKVDHFDATVQLNGAGAAIDQLQAVGTSAAIQHTHNVGAADHVDFDWVQDSIPLETRTTSLDNHAGVDFMTWGIAPLVASNQAGKDKGNWLGGSEKELTLGAFGGTFFNTADVVSQIARYSDQDTGTNGNWSRRQAALDYYLQFSTDGSTWVNGTVTTVFIDGWTTRSTADDYLARWSTDIQAHFVRIAANPLGGNYDGNAQIDAIIVAAVPEPGPAQLAVIGLILSCVYGRARARMRRLKIFA
ncbi:MAG: hypothetical protein U0794_19555 [Isosphaeraceae bacterium]